MIRAWARVALHELRSSGRLWLLLGVGVSVLAYAIAYEFPRFVARFEQMGKHAPPFVRKLLGAQGGVHFESFAAFGYMHPVMLLLMAAWPIARAAAAVAGPIERGSLGWELAYPIGRLPYLFGRALVMLLGVVGLQAVFGVALLASLDALGVHHAGPRVYGHLALVGSLLYGAVGTLTLWASAVSSRAAVPAIAGASLVLASLLLENVGGLYPLVESLRWLSLYHYADAGALLGGAALRWRDLAVLGGCLVAGLAGAAVGFARRDLSI